MNEKIKMNGETEMNKKRTGKAVRLLFVLSLLFTLALTGCETTPSETQNPAAETQTSTTAAPTTAGTASDDGQAAMKSITNVDGTSIETPVKVERVAAIFGPSYEKIVLLGAEDKIVCDGDFHIDGWPWSNVIYKRLNDVPGIPNAHSDLNIEEMLGYDLDVVFNFPNPQTTEALRQAGISVVPMAGTGKMSDIKETVKVYAEALGDGAPARAARYAAYYDEKVKQVTDVTATIPENERVKVYMANQLILKAAGKSSDLVELMQLAGGVCVSAEVEGGGGVEVSREQLLAWDPDFIFVDHAGSSGNASAEDVIKEMLDQDEFSELTAAEKNQIYICPTGVFFWDSGVQKPLLLMWMASTMYPEYLPDLDIKTELIGFYEEFFDYSLTDEEAEAILAHRNP
jgi:iron complex transport system substrate-binding protein